MEKLLHERLREWDRNALGFVLENIDGRVAHQLADEIERDYVPREEYRALGTAQAGSAHHIMRLYGEQHGMPFDDNMCITEWLDKWFIPRPRFEDGEPVQVGDPFIQKIACENDVISNIRIALYGADGLNMVWSSDEVVHRPISKVLDADGVEIKVGDTVYPTYGVYQGKAGMVLDADNEAAILVDVGVSFETYPRTALTHKEPDSFEKLRDDMRECGENMAHFFPRIEVIDFADRLANLIERGA